MSLQITGPTKFKGVTTGQAAAALAGILSRKTQTAAPAPKVAAQAPQPATLAPVGSRAEAGARVRAVLASPQAKGKERLAATMLSDPEYSRLSASALVKVLGHTQAPQVDHLAQAKAEAAALNGSGLASAAHPANNHGWAQVHADMLEMTGRGA
ncbi:MAG: hypothetical protein ABJA20_09325 [Novosphingobium sp.]